MRHETIKSTRPFPASDDLLFLLFIFIFFCFFFFFVCSTLQNVEGGKFLRVTTGSVFEDVCDFGFILDLHFVLQSPPVWRISFHIWKI